VRQCAARKRRQAFYENQQAGVSAEVCRRGKKTISASGGRRRFGQARRAGAAQSMQEKYVIRQQRRCAERAENAPRVVTNRFNRHARGDAERTINEVHESADVAQFVRCPYIRE